MTKIILVDDYIIIEGKKYRGDLIKAAEDEAKNVGFGVISKISAKKLIEVLLKKNVYTEVEKETIKYIQKNIRWTFDAENLFKTELRKWISENK